MSFISFYYQLYKGVKMQAFLLKTTKKLAFTNRHLSVFK
jgi:hypothetical protein